jgi:signal transduction histidine kinase
MTETTPKPLPNILAVDDNPVNLQLLVSMLQDSGYRVRPVTSGAHALKAARSHPPDLILLDVTMPDMDGYEVCRRLKADAATADIPVLFISALADTRDKVSAFEAGGVDYVSKPFQFAEVIARVRTHLNLRQRERDLQESLARERDLERLRDKLTHMIAHDMRSPLLALGLTLEVVQDTAKPEEGALLATAQAALQSLVELVTQMLDVSRIESGALELQQQEVDLVALAKEVFQSLSMLAGAIEMSVRSNEPVVAVVDRDLIRRVLTNLVGNALKFAKRRVEVIARGTTSDPFVRVEVMDDGRGIAPIDHARIFEKFGQIEGDRRKAGTGLGLTFAKMAVEAHGGQIGVISALGEGATFWFTLPMH